jgi:hypothetical protein
VQTTLANQAKSPGELKSQQRMAISSYRQSHLQFHFTGIISYQHLLQTRELIGRQAKFFLASPLSEFL